MNWNEKERVLLFYTQFVEGYDPIQSNENKFESLQLYILAKIFYIKFHKIIRIGFYFIIKNQQQQKNYRKMVYILLNDQIKSALFQKKFRFKNTISIQGHQYVEYADLKKIAKKKKSEIHKFIHRRDIISTSEINRRLKLLKLSQVEKKVIQQIKNKQNFEPKHQSLFKKLSAYSGVIQSNKSIPIVQDVKKGMFLTFLFCATSFSGYLLTTSLEIQPQKASAFGPILGSIVTFLYAMASNKKQHKKMKESSKINKKTMKESASITFKQNNSVNSELKMKRKVKKAQFQNENL